VSPANVVGPACEISDEIDYVVTCSWVVFRKGCTIVGKVKLFVVAPLSVLDTRGKHLVSHFPYPGSLYSVLATRMGPRRVQPRSRQSILV
jgi:hypothetical protein